MLANKNDLEKKAKSYNDDSLDEKPPFISFRWILVTLCFFSYFMQFFIRNSFPVALVAMVNATQSESADVNYTADTCPSYTYINVSDESKKEEPSTGEFFWGSSEQGLMLGAFFWGSFISKLFISRLGEAFGQRATVAIGTSIAAILDLFSPTAARIDPILFAVVRFLVGFCFGPIPPCCHSMISKWAPRSELSIMIASIFGGASIGGMFGLVVSGLLTEHMGWESTFYLGGVISLMFVPFWIILVRNTPEEHPWITPYEKKLLEQNNFVSTQKTVPWIKIFSSPYLYVLMLAQFARLWVDTLISIIGPSFLHYKLRLDLNISSYLCGANYLLSLIAMMIYGKISDYIVNKNYVKKIHSRKLFHLIGAGGACIGYISIALAGCHVTTAVVLWVLLGGVVVGTTCSFNVSIIDLAPNYTGTIMGILAIGNIGAAIAPSITTILLKQENGWNKSFYLASGLCLASCIVYIATMTDEVQPWNFKEEKELIISNKKRTSEQDT